MNPFRQVRLAGVHNLVNAWNAMPAAGTQVS